MKKARITIFLIVFLLMPISVFAAKINSTSYKQTVIVSTGGENASSSSYKIGVAVGIIAKVINSTSYLNKLGFFHVWLLANGQPCTSANQCEGGFCCSSTCRSSACPTEEAAAGGGGGGGAAAGGGSPPLVEEFEDFSTSQSSVKEQVALGQAKVQKIGIRNTGTVALSFDLNVATINDFVFLSDTGFSLDAGQEKLVEANIIGKKLGSYLGEIEISAGGIKKSISVIVEVESEQALFDVKIDIPSGYKEIEAGGELKAQITLLNVGPPKKVDVTTTYMIKDKQGNIVHESSETFAVEKQTSFVKSFKVPKNLAPGDYLAIIELRYENSFAVSSELFRIAPKESPLIQKFAKYNATLAFVFSILIGFMFLFAYLLLPKIKIKN
ncbi:hypothetical protein HYX02_07005 [Candidatus Woesearchaeota archaeon]|nr:hypothetical protein [Candidatus Woesearchaeota archaeon]